MAEGTSVRPGSWNGAKARDGSPEDLRDPIRAHAREPEIKGAGTTKTLGPEEDLQSCGSARASTKKEDRVGGGSETNKRPLMRGWEVVAPS